ncbi:energy transducer TonB [Aestuariibaculum sp. M13]|uniref:energy transducer TonB n=1 Tax=Aestuariibaculum sp. M13 TaxID=2967132 RepID=UPI002159CCD2|nr:energy transducer TonB [Aestuariibaculum sp. M13]MCR8669441.1 energy transducer TonB [Aestuariibaculum sp. M13]
MQKHYSISIPKPCHEDWNKMSPNEKGRFCNSCVKTVVDFTKMNSEEIQQYIKSNSHKHICGHFKQTQIDSINLRISSKTITATKSFHKTFLLALLLVMGTTLMNCTNNIGYKQKIDSIEVFDTLQNKVLDSVKFINAVTKNDTIIKNCIKNTNIPAPNPTGFVEIETLGEIITSPVSPDDDIEDEIDILCKGFSGENIEEDLTFGMIVIEDVPKFKDSPSNLNYAEKKELFQKRISKIIQDNFNTSVCSELKGIQNIATRFKINKEGKIVDIQVRAPHPDLENEAIRVLKLLPEFIPATQRNKPIDVLYNLPIIFNADDQ